MTTTTEGARTLRRDGWTPARRQQFLDGLAAGLDVRRAVARVGLSRRSAYKLRKREAGFARAWAEAQASARAAEEQAFRAALARMFPAAFAEWAECAAHGRGVLPQDCVTCGPYV